MVSTVLHRGSCVVCGMIIWCCRVACARPVREHDSPISMYLAPFRRFSCFVCVIAYVVDMRTRGVRGRVLCCVWSFRGKLRMAWLRGCEGVHRERVLVCVIRLISLFFCPFFLTRVVLRLCNRVCR